MKELKGKLKDVAEEHQKGTPIMEIAQKLGLSASTVKTYISRARKFLGLTPKTEVPKAPSRPRSFSEFKNMVNSMPAPEGSLEERVAQTKELYCSLCPYPNKCAECPTKVIFDKFLY